MELRPTDTRLYLILGVTSAAIGLVTIFVAIRIYIRGYLMRAWKLDDTMFIISVVFVIAQATMVKCGAIYGALGQHIWMLTPPVMKNDARYMVSAALLHQAAFPLVKATYLMQYRRAFALPNITLLCDVFLGVLFVIAAASLILGGVVMRDFNDPDPTKFPDTTSTGFEVFSYLTSASNIATGIVVFIMPIVLVSRMRLATMQKAGLIASFGVGIFTCTISIFRIITMKLGLTSRDPFYDIVPLSLLNVAELTSAIVCACLPLMRPLLSCAGTTGYRTNGYREPLTAESGASASRMRRRQSLPMHSPGNLTSATPQMVAAFRVGGDTDGDVEGSPKARESVLSIGLAAAEDSLTPTKTRAGP
ncbi:hypothetical protein LX36DRAFT_599172 [Colletotrichum falcatum]|nr:hypothetical protein LX36DRAFT_599172 [Colletotrichum falcatum]